MICVFQHDGLCCNSGARLFKFECRECECIVPISNADYIRAMTDTELKKFIVINIGEDRMCKSFCAKTKGECKGFCLSGIEDWLKQPYKGDA